MTRFLVGVDAVHTAAAACDYLADRLAPDDAVRAVAVASGDTDERDAADALNVVPVRLPEADAETELLSGPPADLLLDAADAVDADEIVVGARGGPADAEAGETGLGSTGAAVVGRSPVPVVVVPRT